MGKTKRRTDDNDHHVGARIRELRTTLGISQPQMADQIGVTYQQARKYESGANRISAGRLFEIAQALGVNVNDFFEGLKFRPVPALTDRQRVCMELVRDFMAIGNEKHQAGLAQLARALVSEE